MPFASSSTVMGVPSIIVLNRSCKSSNIDPSSTETRDLEDDNRSTDIDTESMGDTPTSTVTSPCGSGSATSAIASNAPVAANDLVQRRGLQYNENVNPNATPPPVNKVWTALVRLFQEPVKATTPGSASIKEPVVQEQADIPCPEELKNVLKKAYANENLLNVELFNTLHKCLYDAKVVDAFKNQNTKDDATEGEMKPKAKDDAENETKKKAARPKNETKIFFTNGKCGDYVVGFGREANGEQKHQTSQSAPGSMGKQKRDNDTPSSAGNSQQTDTGNSQQTDSGVSANARVDHCACLFVVNKKGKLENVMCLSVIELKLANPRTVTCAAIPKDLTGKALYDCLDLSNTRGSFAQAMLYTMGYVLPGLAKIGQLEATIPWGVVVCKHQLIRKTSNSLHASEPTLEQGSSNTASKSSSTGGKPPLSGTKSDRSNQTPSAGSRAMPRNRNSDEVSTYLSEMAVSEDTLSQSHQSNRWVSGSIYVPEACGKPFRYAVTGFGGFERAEEDESVDNALSVYLDTLLSGLIAAKNWLISIKNGKACRSRPTTGQVVMIGTETLTEKLTSPLVTPTSSKEETRGEESLAPVADVARPASSQAETVEVTISTAPLTLRGRLGKLADLAPNENRPYSEWKIHQGEIFTGTRNIHRLANKINLNDSNFLVFSNEDVDVNVALKVSSKVIHNSLIDPYKAWNALKVLHKQVGAKEEWEEKRDLHNFRLAKGETPKKALPEEPSTPPKLDDVLLAVYWPADNSLITITKDLSADYKALCPSAYKDDLPSLWNAFIELLRNVLIPMANLSIIHPDIRPGCDETSNILCKFSEVDKSKGAVMQLIDFESVVALDFWVRPSGAESLYISKQDDWSAKTFLWWQCVAIAYAWKYGMSQKAMVGFDLNMLVHNYESRKDDTHYWMQGFYVIQNTEPPKREMDIDLLDNLASVFP